MAATVAQTGIELWVLGLLAFVLGLAVGAGVLFALGSAGFIQGRTRRELKQVREELDRYRSSVENHFHKSAELFDTLSDHYQGLYRHMAAGAESLCEPGTPDRALGFATQALPAEVGAEPVSGMVESVEPVAEPDELYRQSEGSN